MNTFLAQFCFYSLFSSLSLFKRNDSSNSSCVDLLVDPAQLLARHGEAGDEGVNVGALAQGELPDGPGQPVAHLVLAPVPGVPGDPELVPDPVPGAVGGLEHVTDTLHVTSIVCWGLERG